MALDLVTLPGAGEKIVADTITALVGGQDGQVQVIKLAVGAEGVLQLISRGPQLDANSLPVVMSTEQFTRLMASFGEFDDVAISVDQDDPEATDKSLLRGLLRDFLAIRSIEEALAASTTPVPTTDKGAEWTSVVGLGSPLARFTSANASAADAPITNVPVSGQKLVLTDVIISVDTAMLVDLKEETSATVKFSFYMAANQTLQKTFRSKAKLDTADKRWMVRTSASGNIKITPAYYSEP